MNSLHNQQASLGRIYLGLLVPASSFTATMPLANSFPYINDSQTSEILAVKYDDGDYD